MVWLAAILIGALAFPDPIVETAIGSAAFFGGVVAIIIVVSLLIGSMMPRIT
jgi:hypothetical protein